MDINLKRRKAETAIADQVLDELISKVEVEPGVAPPPELLGHHVALVWERLGIMPTEASMGRVLGYVLKKMGKLERDVGTLAARAGRVADTVERTR